VADGTAPPPEVVSVIADAADQTDTISHRLAAQGRPELREAADKTGSVWTRLAVSLPAARGWKAFLQAVYGELRGISVALRAQGETGEAAALDGVARGLAACWAKVTPMTAAQAASAPEEDLGETARAEVTFLEERIRCLPEGTERENLEEVSHTRGRGLMPLCGAWSLALRRGTPYPPESAPRD